MNFNTLYRLSFYAMLVFASCVLSVDVLDNRYAVYYSYAVAASAFLAFLTVDRTPSRGISTLLADLLAILATGVAVAEYKADETQLVLALGHWLIYLTIIYMFRPKSPSGDWVMFRLGLFQVMVGTVISQSDTTGAVLFVWAILTLWVLGLFTLQREAIRARTLDRPPGGNGKPAATAPTAGEPHPGLLDMTFLFATTPVTLTTVALGGAFLLLVVTRLGVSPVIAGAFLRPGDLTTALAVSGAALALWVVGVYVAQRKPAPDAGGSGAEAPARRPPPVAAEAELYPGLLNLAFLFSTLRVTLTTLALGGVIFLAMPRRVGMARAEGREGAGQHLTGFDEEVQLGQMGEILENDTVVMSVEFFDEKGVKDLPPEPEPLLRGITMSRYERGRWKRPRYYERTFPSILPDAVRSRDPLHPLASIRQQIKLESNDSKALFGLRPMIEATVQRGSQPYISSLDGTIFRNELRPGPYDYEVRSFRDRSLPQPGETAPGPAMELVLKEIPADIRPRLQAIAEGVIAARVPPELRKDLRARAEALESYLRDSGEFSYTLNLDVDDKTIDPVLDFLINRRQGHCEYFASALALLLRSVEIPARVVNGFKGGDWNELARVMNVRQKHAHSWVEAYLGVAPGADRPPIWLTLDPTPGNERDASVARVSGFRGNFRQFSDFVRYVWLFYIVGYNAERQNALLYGPIRGLIREAKEGFAIMGEWFRKNQDRGMRLLHFPDARSFFSPRGFFVAFGALLVLVGLYYAALWAGGRLLRWYRGPGSGDGELSPGAAQYRRLALLLGGVGLERPAAETQDQFARRAYAFLSGRGPDNQSVADVPNLVVDAFYRVRFGHLTLAPEDAANLETRLDALEATLNAPQDV